MQARQSGIVQHICSIEGNSRQAALWATTAEVEKCEARAVKRGKVVSALKQSGATARTAQRRDSAAGECEKSSFHSDEGVV